ncbi:MAG: hypothetical protein Q9213_005940 [Squamulea squamosa]
MATNVDAKLLKQTRFPPEFSQKVDMKKVNVEVMKKWIAGKISEILGNEDDVVVELCFNLLEGSRFPDIKVLQIQLTGFLDKDTPKFCKELWTLCLSAQSNPQGVPKELLEAKKLELIQEKVQRFTCSHSRITAAEVFNRLTLRKLPRKPSVGEIRNACGTRILIIFGKESELSEVAVVEGVIGDIMSMIGAHPDTPKRRHHGGENLHTELTIVGLRRETTSIHMFPEIGMDGGVTAVTGHLPFDGLLADLCLAQGRRRQGVTGMMTQGPGVAATVLAGRERRFVGVVEETEGKGILAVVVIELDPIHLQIRLAHVHPEDREGDAVLRYHPVVHLLHRGRPIASMAIDEATMMVRIEAAAAAAITVSARSARLPRQFRTQASVYRDSRKGRGVGLYRDMHLLQEDGVTPLQSLHLLKSDTRQLILLKRKRTGHLLNPSAEALIIDR